MKKSLLAIAIAIIGSVNSPIQAAANDGIVGSYLRVDIGRSEFSASGASVRSNQDDYSQAIRIYGGYRFNEALGVEVGYAALGSFSQSIVVDGASVRQDARARSVFAVATGRVPVGDSVALHARLGLSSGKVSGTSVVSDRNGPIGARTSMMIGIGAEYRPRSNIALSINYDDYGRLSDTVSARALLFGLHFGLE